MNWISRFVLPVLLIVLAGCAGTDNVPRQANAGTTGVWRGTVTDPDTGTSYAIEFEQVTDARGRIGGVARVIEARDSHHAALSGTRSGQGFTWTAEFPAPLGRGTLTATPSGENGYSLDFRASGSTLARASGSATRNAAVSADYTGTWTVTWTVDGQSDTFDFTITSGDTNYPIYEYVKLPSNGGWVFAGSVVGDQLQLKAFSGAGTNGLLTQFQATALPGGGTLIGERIWPGGGNFNGTYTVVRKQTP